MTPQILRSLAFAALLLVVPVAALAHAHLKAAQPAPDSTVAASPPKVVVTFTEPLEPKLSKLEVLDEAGKRVDTGALQAVPGDPASIEAALPTLAPGRYTVVWAAASVDTHKTEGRYVFRVQP